jgi:hypothetical protein
MSLFGNPTEWLDLLDSLVPDILDLVIDTWDDMPSLPSDALENPTTELFCKMLRLNRNSSELPFQVHIQMVELDPAADQEQGRMDITFCPLVPRENIYFSLECKRLRVMKDRKLRSYAAEYVAHGMMRFVRGQYASMVRNGGMLGYVMDANLKSAIADVGSAVQKKHEQLGMSAPGQMFKSTIKPDDERIRETHHERKQQHLTSICVHHIFLPGMKPSPSTTSASVMTGV